MSNLPILEQRRIEAELIREVFETLKERHGAEEAQAIVAESVRRSAVAQAAAFAKATPEGTSLQSFVDIQSHWRAGDALRFDVVHHDETSYAFKVTRCLYAETYKAMGLGEIGHLLSCNRDAAFCEGYDPSLKLTRTQTLMEGATHCDFRYRYEPAPADMDDAGSGVEDGGEPILSKGG